MELSLSWTSGSMQHQHSGEVRSPSWPAVDSEVTKALVNKGVVTLMHVGPDSPGPQNLQLRAENGNFLLTLGEDDGNDYLVRTLANAESHFEMIAICGDDWDSRLITRDAQLVMSVFKEFYDQGDVSRELMP